MSTDDKGKLVYEPGDNDEDKLITTKLGTDEVEVSLEKYGDEVLMIPKKFWGTITIQFEYPENYKAGRGFVNKTTHKFEKGILQSVTYQ